VRLKRPIALSFLFLLLNAAAWAAPEWTYPLAANILEDKGGYLVLTNKSVLMDASFEPHDLVTLNLRATNRGYELRGEAAEALVDWNLPKAAELFAKVVATWPNDAKAPAALMAQANAQLEAGDAKGSRKTLERVVKDYPATPEGQSAKQRLKK